MKQQEKMDEYSKMAIMDIMESKNTYEKIRKFKSYGDKISKCRIFLFDEEYSNFDSSFKNCKIGRCGILGAGDYTKTWILDSQHISGKTYIQAGKTIDFDLNILTYLNKIMQGRKINIDDVEFVNYLNYLKINGFQCGITTALMERVKTPIDLNIFSEMLTSFVKFDNMSLIDRDCTYSYLSTDDYIRIKQIYDMALGQNNEVIHNFDLLCCCVMKAFLIKNYDSDLDKEEKVEKFIKYCLNVLNCYLEKEIVLLSLYIVDDNRTHKTFEKLKNNAEIIKNILNVTWDIFHIRLIEQIMLHDNIMNKEQVILSYYATADNGLIDAMQINPIKAFVILRGISISYHSIRIKNICNNALLIDVSTMASIRAKKISTVDFTEISQKLKREIIARQLD